MQVGYIRVSTETQNTTRQLEDIEIDKLFVDYASGKSLERPKLNECLSFVREGDTLIIHSMDRLARNLVDLRNIVEMLTQKGVAVQFVKENLTFNNQNNPISQLLLSVMGAFAEFERALINERQKEGITAAKKRGVYTGRKRKLTAEQLQIIQKQICNKEKTPAECAKEYNLNPSTIYRSLNRLRQTENQ